MLDQEGGPSTIGGVGGSYAERIERNNNSWNTLLDVFFQVDLITRDPES